MTINKKSSAIHARCDHVVIINHTQCHNREMNKITGDSLLVPAVPSALTGVTTWNLFDLNSLAFEYGYFCLLME